LTSITSGNCTLTLKIMKKDILAALFLSSLLLVSAGASGQLKHIILSDTRGLTIERLTAENGKEVILPHKLPLLSYDICLKNDLKNKTTYTTGASRVINSESDGIIRVSWLQEEGYNPGVKGTITFTNISSDTLWLTNVIPLGKSDEHVYITGEGEHRLSRTHLFLPGKKPVNVIVPDNAWELGFSAIKTDNNSGITALTRRIRESLMNAIRRRFETEIYPGGSVQYVFYADLYNGEWQEALRLMFQERMLYDVEPGTFNNSLYKREDLKWIRHAYASTLIMAWDDIYYDYVTDKFGMPGFVSKTKDLYGGDDFIGIWPTWPTLGIDQRNQWDLFRDLPGGTEKIKELGAQINEAGTRLFICYNPWDESTREEGHAEGMAEIIKATNADGVVLDTMGESSAQLQDAADGVKEGVIMYSEGMAIPRNMQGIISGRVHNALYYPPVLNLNKFIKPDFSIFRVAELYIEPIRREYSVSLFNGYGTEMNIFGPGKPSWADEQYRYWGKTLRILRENTHNFVDAGFTPLVPVSEENIWVNKWPGNEKTIYTIFSLIPEGYKDYLLDVSPTEGYHYVDLWNNEELEPVKIEGQWKVMVTTSAFPASDSGTNNEGAAGVIAMLPEVLHFKLESDLLTIGADKGNQIRVWAGEPEYGKDYLELPAGLHKVRLLHHFGRYEGKFVVQLLEDKILLDQRVFEIRPGTPRLMTFSETTPTSRRAPRGMVEIPAGTFVFKTTNGDEFIRYPTFRIGDTLSMSSFFMDKHPVTNREFQRFLKSSGYRPADPANFLKHWIDGKIPEGMEDFPVVYVSWEDASAYARWADKRLPTEIEWQYAAQTHELREWPWEQKEPVTRKHNTITSTLTVFEIEGISEKHANPGNGNLYKVGSYPEGVNPNGLEDLVGCVWQLTNDIYFSGSYRTIMMKGGSYFKPSSSWWYVQGGPRELHFRQQLLRVSQGFERNATVGFRCVKNRRTEP
jgi:gamma-glutamyl hercynylcysteine S-oxide synthase